MKFLNRNLKTLILELVFIALSLLVLGFIIVFSRQAGSKGAAAVMMISSLYCLAVIAFILGNIYLRYRSLKNEVEEKKKRIVSLMNIVNAFVAVWSEDKSILIVNEKLEEYIAPVRGKYPTNRDIIDKLLFPQSFMTQTKADMMLSETRELPLKINDAVVFTAWTSSVLMYGQEGRYIVSIGFDVSENKQIRQELNITNNRLSSSERLYSLAMSLSEIGIILNEHCSDYFSVSKELQTMLGIESDQIRIEDFVGLIHRDDSLMFETYLKVARKNNVESLHSDNIEMRLRTSDGSYRWFSFRYKNVQQGKYGMPILGGAIIDISREKEKDIIIERLAYIDEITGINNRNRLMINGQEMYECCKILELSYWVIVFDIDNFHIINDTCGYERGNQTLRYFSELLEKYKRKTGFAARVAGDTFVLIIQDYGDDNVPLMVIRSVIEEFSELGKDSMFNQTMTCSAGYSKMPDDGEDFETVLERAEFALSTGEKKTSIIRYDSSVHDSIITRTELEKSLADAIEAGELCLFYQPKVSIKTRKIIGVEALIRWIKPNGEVIEPSRFVPVAENSHLITRIGEFVMNEACRQNKKWQDMGLPKIVMSINLTSEDFYQKNIKEYIQKILDDTGLPTEWLEIELTESLAMKDIDFAVAQMQELRDMGLKLAMDDFGTGYSSLSYIQKMPISLLKLDMSFIMMLENDLVAQEIVSAVIKIAKSKKIETIAEGTETEAQVEILKNFGCDYAQGFLFGKPMSADDLTEYLRRSQT